MMHVNPIVQPTSSVWRNYIELCKPRVVLLMLLTVVVGMYLATPGWVNLFLLSASLLGIGLCAGSAAAINHLVDKRIDAIMARTKKACSERPSFSAPSIMVCFNYGDNRVNCFSGFCEWINCITHFYHFDWVCWHLYRLFKASNPAEYSNRWVGRRCPPLLGWTSVTNQLDPQALLLVLIIFIWTPPHFWALAIYRYEEYQHAQIPMLPVTHGIQFTKLNIYLYTILLVVVSVLPFVIGMSGLFYLIGALVLGARFLYWAYQLYHTDKPIIAMQTFRFSIVYLMLLFVFLLIDHYL